MEELQKIDSQNYLREIQAAFKQSPLAYSQSIIIITKLENIRDKALEYSKEQNYFEAACILKALLEKTIEELNYINDYDGAIGKFVFELFDIYYLTLKDFDYDQKSFYQDTVELLLNEELGFAFEIEKLLFTTLNEENRHLLESALKQYLKIHHNKLLRETLLLTLIKLYDHFGDNNKYIETCLLLPKENWERYVFIAEKLEGKNLIEKALKVYEEGVKHSIHFKDLVSKKLLEFKERHLVE